MGPRVNQTLKTDFPLIVSVSGVRGIVGESLTPRVAMDFAAAYGSALGGGTVAVSRDGRSTGLMLARAVSAGLLSVGSNVVEIGIAATPTAAFFVKHTGCAGGVQITASHNPPPWNGLKLFRAAGFVVGAEEGAGIAARYRANEWPLAAWDRVGRLTVEEDPHEPHLARVLANVDVAAIRKRRFRVLLDANHASGGEIGRRLLEMLGCETLVLGGKPDGLFEHPPEPTAENLQGVAATVGAGDFDVGFAVDPDADRLALVDERGRYIGEEYTLALAIEHRLEQKKGPVVINGSTSLLSETAARRAGAPVHRTKVGEVHVAEEMLAADAVIGGEGNGGVIDPRIGMGRDSVAGMALILERMATSGRSLSDLADAMPSFAIRKEKFTVPPERVPALLARIASEFADARIDRQDGVRAAWDDGWIQVRASNTEPIVRLIAEAEEAPRVDALCDKVRRVVDESC